VFTRLALANCAPRCATRGRGNHSRRGAADVSLRGSHRCISVAVRRSAVRLFFAAVCAACARSSPSPAPVSTAVTGGESAADPPPSATPSATPITVSDGSGVAPRQFRTCKVDADCVAVDRVGCCHNGWKEAVSTAQRDAYARSFTCPDAQPICAMYIVRDERAVECDGPTHLCVMVRVEDVACGAPGDGRHACPEGYTCAPPTAQHDGGKCVR
jgi:hypothetical protein